MPETETWRYRGQTIGREQIAFLREFIREHRVLSVSLRSGRPADLFLGGITQDTAHGGAADLQSACDLSFGNASAM